MESHHIPMVVTSTQQPKGEDIFEGNVVSDVFKLSNWGGAYVTVTKLAGTVGTATFGVEACDDNVPTTSPALTGGWWFRYQTTPDVFSAWELEADATTAITAGANSIWEFYIPSSILEGAASQLNYGWCRFTLTETESTAVDGGVHLLLVDPKVAQSIPATVIA